MIEKILSSYGIDGRIEQVLDSPLAKTIGVKLALGQNLNKVKSMAEAISLYMDVPPCRCYFKNGLAFFEIPKTGREIVCVKSIKTNLDLINLPIPLGITVDGKNLSIELASAPHILVAGATGSGKSVCLNVMIDNLLENGYVSLLLIDPKQVEFAKYKGRVIDIATDVKKSIGLLSWLVSEMDRRYSEFEKCGVKNHNEYIQYKVKRGEQWVKKIVCVIDELADLIMQSKKEVEFNICRLAQLARAAGIHLVVATQRPSAEVITGIIRSNLPTKIAFKVSKKSDSRIIFDETGAEKLTGKGDGLYLNPKNNDLIRFQCAFSS